GRPHSRRLACQHPWLPEGRCLVRRELVGGPRLGTVGRAAMALSQSLCLSVRLLRRHRRARGALRARHLLVNLLYGPAVLPSARPFRSLLALASKHRDAHAKPDRAGAYGSW